MSNSKHLHDGNRFHASLKAAVVVAALGFAALAIEQPRLAAAPSESRHVAAASAESRDGAVSPAYGTEALAAPMTELPASASEYLPAGAKKSHANLQQISAPASEVTTTYFPAQFGAPQGEAEPLPPTF